jgi:hypothetical protein
MKPDSIDRQGTTVSATAVVKPAVESGESCPLTAGDAARLAAEYTRYALDRL